MALRIPISVCLCEVDVVLEKRGGGLRVYTLPGPAERFKSWLGHPYIGPCISFCFCLVMLSYFLILKTEGFHLYFLQF